MNDIIIHDLEIKKNEQKENAEKALTSLQLKIAELEINDNLTYGIATELLKQLKIQIKNFDGYRKEAVKPLNDLVGAWNSEFNPILDKAENIKKPLEQKIIEYQKMIEEKRRQEAEAEKQRKLDEIEAVKKRQEVLDKLNDTTERMDKYGEQFEEVKQLVENKPIIIEKGFVSDAGVKTRLRDNWKYRIVDPLKIPRDYLEPSDKLIKLAAKNDTIRQRGIEGIEFYNDPIVVNT